MDGGKGVSPWDEAAAEVPDVRVVVPDDVAHDPLVTRYLTGRVTSTSGFRWLGSVAVLFSVLLPAGLIAAAATSSSAQDASRAAQLVWSGILVVSGAFTVWMVGRSRTTVTEDGLHRVWCLTSQRVRWENVSGFDSLQGAKPGLWVIQRGSSPLRVPTPWHKVSFDAATVASEQLNALFGVEDRRRWGAPGEGVHAKVVAETLRDPEVSRLVRGSLLTSRNFVALAAWSSLLGVVLPAGLLITAAASTPSQDTSRGAQVAWAVVLFVGYLLMLVVAALCRTKTDSKRIRTRTLFRTQSVVWPEVQAFIPHAGHLAALTWAGDRVPVYGNQIVLGTGKAARRLATTAGHLNDVFELGVPITQCAHCGLQFTLTSAMGCRYHPRPPERAGTIGQGEDERSRWRYPCCELVVIAFDAPDGEVQPSLSASGCQTGTHVGAWT